MKTVPSSGYRNNLLATMQQSDLTRLLPYLEYVELPKDFSLSEPRVVSDFTYFLETGIGSIFVSPANGQRAEIGLFGREGLAPTSSISGIPSLPFQVIMHVAGHAFRIANLHLWGAMAESSTLRSFLSRYLQSVTVQIGYTAYANTTHKIEARLARWLLMCHDRTEGDTIELTHEAISAMLAIRRQSVTTTLHDLEGKQLIYASRGSIIIRNRAGLRILAAESYGPPEGEYVALVGGGLSKG